MDEYRCVCVCVPTYVFALKMFTRTEREHRFCGGREAVARGKGKNRIVVVNV